MRQLKFSAVDTEAKPEPATSNEVLELGSHELNEASGGALTAGVAIVVIGAAAGAVYGVVKSAYRLGNVLGEMLVENHYEEQATS